MQKEAIFMRPRPGAHADNLNVSFDWNKSMISANRKGRFIVNGNWAVTGKESTTKRPKVY